MTDSIPEQEARCFAILAFDFANLALLFLNNALQWHHGNTNVHHVFSIGMDIGCRVI